ncbi:Protein CBR-SRZ-4 [Caenorhabditis briggsae]|uniref:Protein CBR-SRZ-4 n=1 Tax=Caenorhabditis briggsae TaxID=6238 RepID=A8WW45_CAEBR|nr:Protein CBR-SRZ-4 [Caenorhabditis briggsae]CAP24854.2 Protein CBR-SRZ-4 [Caenorhabditis briggsae]
MNSSSFFSEPSAFIAVYGIGCFVFIIYLTSIFITFPLYVYVHRLNRKSEKSNYFYPITKHFYSVMCSMQFYSYVTISIALIAWLFFELTAAGSVLIVSLFFAYSVAVIVTSVQNVLLFVLALRRFMILFLPNFKKVISIDAKSFKIWLRVMYVGYTLVQVSSKVVKVFCGTDSIAQNALLKRKNHSKNEENLHEAYEDCSATTDMIYVRIYIAGDVLVMLAAVLYVIMFIKIRKWSKMTSDSLNNPEKYLFYQTLLIVIAKLLAMTIILILFYEGRDSSDAVFATFVFSDIATTPFVIQGSYLLCNRSNVDTILSIQFKKMKTWNMIICGSGSVSEGRQRRREFKRKIIEAKRKAEDLLRGDKTISKLAVNVIPIHFIQRRVENIN